MQIRRLRIVRRFDAIVHYDPVFDNLSVYSQLPQRLSQKESLKRRCLNESALKDNSALKKGYGPLTGEGGVEHCIFKTQYFTHIIGYCRTTRRVKKKVTCSSLAYCALGGAADLSVNYDYQPTS